MDSKNVVSCMGIVCCEKNGEIYIALLQDNNNNWIIPKGHQEKNETFIETAIREIYEETKIKLTSKDLVDKIGEYQYFSTLENCLKLIKAYCFKISTFVDIIPQVEEKFKTGMWVKIEESIDKISYPEQKEMLLVVQNIFH